MSEKNDFHGKKIKTVQTYFDDLCQGYFNRKGIQVRSLYLITGYFNTG